MPDMTPLPGTLLHSEQAVSIINAFRNTYRVRTEGREPAIPTWCTFPEGVTVDEHILEHPALLKYQKLYFYKENGSSLYEASLQQIQQYFQRRIPWATNEDLYVFDAQLTWCIAFTHELMHGVAVILVGNLETDVS